MFEIPYEDSPFNGFIQNVHQQIQDAYKKGLGDGWFQGYDQGFGDGESEAMYDQDQNPYREN